MVSAWPRTSGKARANMRGSGRVDVVQERAITLAPRFGALDKHAAGERLPALCRLPFCSNPLRGRPNAEAPAAKPLPERISASDEPT